MNYFADASKARARITNVQAKSIKKMYRDLSKEIAKEADSLKNRENVSSILRVKYLKSLKKQINAELRQIGQAQSTSIKAGMKAVSQAVVDNNTKFLASLGIQVKDAFSYIPRDVVNSIATGQLYKDRWDLSSSIWNNLDKNRKDIDDIIAKGIAAQKSTYEIAKDLEKYVNPSAVKSWDWSKVYPGTAKKIDYNAQRLARTMISHAYQDSVVRVTKDNPFVDCYEWMTSGDSDRVCEICQERESGFHGVIIDGEYKYGCYYVDDVPLDHPNGMCVIAPFVSQDFTSIANRLADWVEGTPDNDLDNFAKSLGYSIDTFKGKVSV